MERRKHFGDVFEAESIQNANKIQSRFTGSVTHKVRDRVFVAQTQGFTDLFLFF